MDEASLQSHLSRISTEWTLLREAHGETHDAVLRAQAAMLDRYRGAVYRYLLAVLRNAHAADEVFQEFALKFLKGDFRRADPGRGRFRDYLKNILLRMVFAYRRKSHRPEQPLDAAAVPEQVEEAEQAGADFEANWREELLRRAWDALAEHERSSGQPYYAALRLRAENPEASSAEMAESLSRNSPGGQTHQAAGFRKLLQRARERFADLLLAEVAQSIETEQLDNLEEELIVLNLHSHCRSAMQRRRRARPGG